MMNTNPLNVMATMSSEQRLQNSSPLPTSLSPHHAFSAVQQPPAGCQQASSTEVSWPNGDLNANNHGQINRLPPDAQTQYLHRVLGSLLAGSAAAGLGTAFPNSVTKDRTALRSSSLSPAAPCAPDTQHVINSGVLNHDAADYPLPSLPGIRTGSPISRTSSGIKECCHCGKTEEKWRRYSTVPQDDMRPLCNRCFMWRRNRGGSASFHQDLLPSADMLLASNTSRSRATSRSLFRQDSKVKKQGSVAVRSRLSSWGGSAADSYQDLGLAPDTPDFLQSTMFPGMHFNSTSAPTAAAAPYAGDTTVQPGAAAATWQSWGTYPGSFGLGMPEHLPGQQFNQLGQQLVQSAPPAVATTSFPETAQGTTASLPPMATHCSPHKNSLLKSHLGIRKPLSKSPSSRPKARLAITSSNPGTPLHHHSSCEQDLWTLHASGKQQYTRGGSRTPSRRSGNSGGGAPAGMSSPASPGFPSDKCKSAVDDPEVTEAAEVLAELMRLQSRPSNAAQDMSGCLQATQQGRRVTTAGPSAVSIGMADAGPLIGDWARLPEILPLDTGLLAPETPKYAAAASGGANGTSIPGMTALLHAVNGIPWANGITATNSTDRGVPNIETAGYRAAGGSDCPAVACASTARGETLVSALGQDMCNVLSVATVGCLAAAADLSNVELPVQPEVLQAFVAAMLAGVPVNTEDLSSV